MRNKKQLSLSKIFILISRLKYINQRRIVQYVFSIFIHHLFKYNQLVCVKYIA